MTNKFVAWLMAIGGEGKYLTAKWYAGIFAALLYGICGLAFIVIAVVLFVFVVYEAMTFCC